jgi:hypothetical protein
MKFLWKLLALAMIGEGVTLCVAQRQYLEMWGNVCGGLKHWIDWFEEHDSKTRALAVMEICCGMLLLNKTR